MQPPFGAMKGIRQNLKFDTELLYVAALFHDLGLVDAYHTATKRFEVDGPDAARAFLKSHGIPDPKADLVWESVALHTTPGDLLGFEEADDDVRHGQFRLHRTSRSDISQAERVHPDPQHALAQLIIRRALP
ncbi:MAG: phosphohydrolase [Tardiphaga sp.]|nr:phosphohydrolase [Tardiphaga sp.]